MSNYATLIAAIQSVITENGNNEITGTILQQTLLSMINSLGIGYQFVGIATPDTIPGTPDQRVFFIASSGTYPNFGPAVIPDGKLAVFYYDTSWHNATCDVTAVFQTGQSVTQIAIDNTHLANPKDGALPTANDVLQLKAKLDGVTAEDIKVTPIEDWHPEGSSSGYYNNGSWTNNSNFKNTRIDVSGYESIRFLGYNHHFNSFTPQYVFFDDNNNPIGGYHEYYDSTIEDGKDIELNLLVPDGAKYLVCLYKAYYASGGTTYISESKFYAYLQKGDTVVGLIDKSKVQVVDNLDTDDATKALSAKQGKILSEEIFGEITYDYDVDVNIQYRLDFTFRPVTTELNSYAVTGRANGVYYVNSEWYTDFVEGNRLYVKAGTNAPTYLMFLKQNLGKISAGSNKTLQWLVDGDYLCSNHYNSVSNTWTSAIVIPAGEESYIDIPQDCHRIIIGLNTTYVELEPCQFIKIGIAKREGGIADEIQELDERTTQNSNEIEELYDSIYGEETLIENEVNFDSVSVKTGQLLSSSIAGSSSGVNGRIWVVPVNTGDTLEITAQSDKAVYLCILNDNPTIPPNGIPAEDIPIATNCEGYITSGAGNYRMVIGAGSSATINIANNSDAKYVYVQKLFHSSTTPLTPQSFVIQKEKREGGIIDESKVDAGFYLTIEHGDIDGSGKIIPDDNKAVTNFINNGNGFYIELENGFYVERAVLYDKSGNLVTYNYYVHSTSGHASTDNNCWGNNEQLPQFLVRLVLKSESDISVPLNNIVKRFVYLNDNRLTKVLPQNLDYAKFMYKLHQLTNVIWVPVEKAQHNYGGDGINNVLWFLKGTIVTGVPYSTETEYSKFIGIDVALRTFLSAAKNKRSVIYTECVEQSHARSAYGLSYHGEANYTGNFYGSVCTGLTSYLLGYNVNEYVGSMDTKLGNANKIAHGKETLYWGDNVVTIDDLAQQLQPMDIILNSSHISVISDVYKDEYGVVQYVVWTEQTGPTARMIPYSKDMLAKRFANKEFSIYRLPSETWADALAKDVENTKDIIQNSFFDFEPKDVEIDPDISTFEGEYAVFVDNADNDNTDSYNNYKAFLNIHRGRVYGSLQIFREDEDVSTASPIEVNISTNSGTFIYNSSIYADDSMDKDDWIVVDLMQLSPKLAAGKYKARVVGSNIESGFTHFQIVRISMTPTWNGNYVTRLDFNVEGGDAVSVSQQNNIRPIRIMDISASEQGRGYVTFSGAGWNASDYYIKLVVRADYGTAVKKINKSSYSS